MRDRNGRPVTDLSAADFEVAEDGVAQKVDTFTRVSRGGGIGVGVAWKIARHDGCRQALRPTAPAAAAAPDALADEATTALVFDHLSSESLRLAQRATLDYVPMTGESSVRVGVFATDPGIRVMQRYTTDRALVRQAVERVMPSGTSAEEQKAERTDDLMGRRRELRGQTAASAAGGVAATAPRWRATRRQIGERETELRLIQTELNMIRSFDNLDRAHKGYDTVAGAAGGDRNRCPTSRAARRSSSSRKACRCRPRSRRGSTHVIDAANRANVTTYAVDAQGPAHEEHADERAEGNGRLRRGAADPGRRAGPTGPSSR